MDICKTAKITGKPFQKPYADKIKVFATTVIRCTKDNELTGYLLEIDWKTNRITKKIPIPIDTSHPFWNDRGGNRGGRGIAYFNGVLYVATAMSILKYDISFNLLGEITHPYLGGLHEIFINDEGIWVTSTLHDLLIKLDFNGNMIEQWYAGDSDILQQEFKFSSRDLNLNLNFPEKDFSNHYDNYCKEVIFHINSVFPHNNSVYFLSSRLNAFIRFKPDIKVIVRDKELGAPHNGIISSDDKVIINDTRNQCIRVYDLESGRRLSSLVTPVYGALEQSVQFANNGWQRGLFSVDKDVYLVGTSPAAIFEVNLKEGTIGQVCHIDSDVRHCIHGLTVVKNL